MFCFWLISVGYIMFLTFLYIFLLVSNPLRHVAYQINVNSQRKSNLPVPTPVFRGSMSDFWVGVGSVREVESLDCTSDCLNSTIHIFPSSIIQVLGVVLPVLCGKSMNICSTALKHPIEMAIIGPGERCRQSTGSTWLLLVQG